MTQLDDIQCYVVHIVSVTSKMTRKTAAMSHDNMTQSDPHHTDHDTEQAVKQSGPALACPA